MTALTAFIAVKYKYIVCTCLIKSIGTFYLAVSVVYNIQYPPQFTH